MISPRNFAWIINQDKIHANTTELLDKDCSRVPEKTGS